MTDEVYLKMLLKFGKREKIEEFYEYLYDKYKPLLIFISSKYLNDFEDIKDVVQDTFIYFYNHIENDHSNIKALLSITCKHKAIDLLRKKKKVDIVNYDEIGEIIDINDYSHLTYLETIDNMRNVLSKKEVDIVLRHIINDESFINISKDISLNVNSVKSIYYRAIEKYKKYEESNK